MVKESIIFKILSLLIIIGCFQGIVSSDQNGRRQLDRSLAAIVEQVGNIELSIPSGGFLSLTHEQNQALGNQFDAVKNLPSDNPKRVEIEQHVRFLQTFSR